MIQKDAVALPIVLIPAYNPDQKLLNVVDGLCARGFLKIIIINDGSKQECAPVFSALEQNPCCTIYVHQTNCGKGRALKTGLSKFCTDFAEQFVITADADGQHDPDSILQVAETITANPDALVLGVRDFTKLHIPRSNRFGNVLTMKIVKLLLGYRISDTQTGLRAMSRQTAQSFLDTEGERYEYEMNMLLDCKKKQVKIVETPIETIYINNNESSHFNPLVDSFKIYLQFFKFASSSLAAAVLDILLFMMLFKLMIFGGTLEEPAIYFATLFARIISMSFNYYVNHKSVFRSTKKKRRTFLPYTLLAGINVLFSAYLINWALGFLPSSSGVLLVLKILVNLVLFFLNYYVQKRWVF